MVDRRIDIRRPAHTMSNGSAANGVFDQANTQSETPMPCSIPLPVCVPCPAVEIGPTIETIWFIM